MVGLSLLPYLDDDQNHDLENIINQMTEWRITIREAQN
jgi:hypothetical protein